MKLHAALGVALCTGALAAAQAGAQAYPAKPIRVIVPFPAGGTSDILTRMIGAEITKAWGQQVLADNRPGANGNIGVELLVRSAPDGYTLILMDVGNLTISPSVFRKLPFDILRDMAPVSMVSYSSHLTGECDVLFLGMLQSLHHAKSGKVKALAVSSDKRDPALPDVPTVGETPGLEGFVTGSWQGMLAPARTPPEIVARVNAEVVRIIGQPDIREKLTSQGTTPLPMSPPEFGKWLIEQKDRWAKLVKDTGFTLE